MIKKQLKILIFLRLYSGLRSSILNDKWKPSGVPAISSLLEKISTSEFKTNIFFYLNEKDKKFQKKKSFFIKDLNLTINIINSPFNNAIIPLKIKVLLNYVYFSFQTVAKALKHKPDLTYTDRGNVLGGALLARFLKMKVILRVLGMPNNFYSYLNKNKFLPFILRYAYRSNFNTLICTNDGSSIKKLIKNNVKKNIPCFLKINGTSKNNFSKLNISKKIKIIFLGRMEKNKGTDILLKALLKIPLKELEKIEIKIVGDGDSYEEMQKFSKTYKLCKVIKFTKNISNKEVKKILFKSDIYISLNQDGQMSNANLEAISSGLCVIFSKTNIQNDKPTIKIGFNEQNICWIENDNTGVALSNTLIKLIKNPNQITFYKRRARVLSQNLPSLTDRINWEIELIKNVGLNN